MVFEKLTSLQRLIDGSPLLLTACIVHGLGLAGGLATLRMRTLRMSAAEAGATTANQRFPANRTLPWAPGEAWLLMALPLVWWFGFILGPEEPAMKGLVNSLGEPALVAALGVGYLCVRRATPRDDRAPLLHFAMLAVALAIAGLLGWLFPLIDFGATVP